MTKLVLSTKDLPAMDVERVSLQIQETIRQQVLGELRRKGVVVGLSGGIDSSVVMALCAKALGPEKVLGLFMPERDSASDSLRLGQLLASAFGVPTVVEDIGPAAQAIGCYRRQIEAIRKIFPEYGEGWKCKLTLPSLLDSDRLPVFQLTIEDPSGKQTTSRMPPDAYLQLVAATNFKQRLRKNMEYYHADRLAYVVAGTPNRLEYDQGFFVKNGDGAADIKPIAHLYKTQVYALADHLGVPEEIRKRPPTTDTFSMSQTQEEFYFSLPYQKMDVCLAAFNRKMTPEETAPLLDLTPSQVKRVFGDIEKKRKATRYLHLAPLLIEPLPELSSCRDS